MQIHLVDTAGMERYARLTRHHYFGSHVVLLVYDCDDNLSLEALKDFYKDARDNASGAAMVLVRNKIDKEFQSVDVGEAEHLVCNHSTQGTYVCKFRFKAETSAKENWGIQELFQKVAEYLIKNAQPSKRRGNKFDSVLKLQESQQEETTPPSTSNGCGC